MGEPCKGSAMVTLLLLLAMAACCCSSASRLMHGPVDQYSMAVRRTAKPSAAFSGFFPKAMPIPPSGPSKKHNSIGLRWQRAP